MYAKIFATGIFNSACRRWNDRIPAEQTWNSFKTHFAMAYRQHKQLQGGQMLPPGTPTQLWHNLLMNILQEQRKPCHSHCSGPQHCCKIY
jgi:hypothetical protein